MRTTGITRQQDCVKNRKKNVRKGKSSSQKKICCITSWQQYQRTLSGGSGKAEGFGARGSSPPVKASRKPVKAERPVRKNGQ
jgi:hypothetical protein